MNQEPDREHSNWGTQRRLKALARLGWSPHAISKATRILLPQLTAVIADQNNAWPALNQRVAAACDRLQNQQPPKRTRRQQERARTTRTEAIQKWWPPPEAWRDNEIDHPYGQPRPEWIPDSGCKRLYDLNLTAPEAEAQGRLQIESDLEEERVFGWEPGQ